MRLRNEYVHVIYADPSRQENAMPRTLEEIRGFFTGSIEAIHEYSAVFLFSTDNRPYLNSAAIQTLFDAEWREIEPLLHQRNTVDEFSSLLFPSRPYDLKIIPRFKDFFSSFRGAPCALIQDMCAAGILRKILERDHGDVSPQLYLELLFLFKLRAPEFLIVIDPIMRIIADTDKRLERVIRSDGCEVLINNYEIERLIIFISLHPELSEDEKQTLFQSLAAYQKIYRKYLELRVSPEEKDAVSLTWFGISYERLRHQSRWREGFSVLVRDFFERFLEKKDTDATEIGRFLTIRFSNEDILRRLHQLVIQDERFSRDRELPVSVHRAIFDIMQDFRRRYISRKVDDQITRDLIRAETQHGDAMRLITIGQVPAYIVIRGKDEHIRPLTEHPLLAELEEPLERLNLTALFQHYPIPVASQELLTHVAKVSRDLDLKGDDHFTFISHMEKLLIFLQQLAEIGIVVERSGAYAIVKNPYQMKSLGLIKERAYFGSTGLWSNSMIPPCVIECISPDAIPNCLGAKERHIFCRVSLLTGGFRGSPFDLDSTNRYDWDEDTENCQFRPGYFQILIPEETRRRWENTQSVQMEALKSRIQQKHWM